MISFARNVASACIMARRGRAGFGRSNGPSTILIVGAGIVVILLLFGCLIFLGASAFMIRSRTLPVVAPMPAGSTMEFELEEADLPPDETPSETPAKPGNLSL